MRDPSRTTYAESVGLLEEAVRLMPRTAPRGLSRDDRQQALKDFGATAALGASLALALRDNLTDAAPHTNNGPAGLSAAGPADSSGFGSLAAGAGERLRPWPLAPPPALEGHRIRSFSAGLCACWSRAVPSCWASCSAPGAI
ncbi:hypothetical protein ACFQVA_18400 [Actinomadura keratinilytica]